MLQNFISNLPTPNTTWENSAACCRFSSQLCQHQTQHGRTLQHAADFHLNFANTKHSMGELCGMLQIFISILRTQKTARENSAAYCRFSSQRCQHQTQHGRTVLHAADFHLNFAKMNATWGEHEPAYYVATHTEKKEVVVAIRGTWAVEDVITDITALPVVSCRKQTLSV